MLNEPLIIMALGTGLMLVAAQVRRWRMTQAQTTPEACGDEKLARKN